MWVKEQYIRNERAVAVTSIGKTLIVATESIVIVCHFHTVNAICLVKTFEKPAIEEWHGRKHIYNLLFGYTEHLGIAIKILDIAMTLQRGEPALVSILVYNGTIERSKKEIL